MTCAYCILAAFFLQNFLVIAYFSGWLYLLVEVSNVSVTWEPTYLTRSKLLYDLFKLRAQPTCLHTGRVWTFLMPVSIFIELFVFDMINYIHSTRYIPISFRSTTTRDKLKMKILNEKKIKMWTLIANNTKQIMFLTFGASIFFLVDFLFQM